MTDIKSILAELDKKMLAELNASPSQPYEALQYVQSYLARKKKTLGQSNTSLIVFHAATRLAQKNAPETAGVLLTWFIEDGAGADYVFRLQSEKVSDANYCDVERLSDFLGKLTADQAAAVVGKIFNPLHVIIAKKRDKSSDLSSRIKTAESIIADTCEKSKKWLFAFKSYSRLNEWQKISVVLNEWSKEAYKMEKPIFFARGLIQLLADRKISGASSLLRHSIPLIKDNIKQVSDAGGNNSPFLAVWHLAVTLTELASLPPMQRVEKRKLCGILVNRYSILLLKLDMKLYDLTLKAAEAAFGYTLPAEQTGGNPMAMLQGLFGGGGPGNGNAQRNASSQQQPAMPDMNTMMQMMSAMQNMKR